MTVIKYDEEFHESCFLITCISQYCHIQFFCAIFLCCKKQLLQPGKLRKSKFVFYNSVGQKFSLAQLFSLLSLAYGQMKLKIAGSYSNSLLNSVFQNYRIKVSAFLLAESWETASVSRCSSSFTHICELFFLHCMIDRLLVMVCCSQEL